MITTKQGEENHNGAALIKPPALTALREGQQQQRPFLFQIYLVLKGSCYIDVNIFWILTQTLED